jgi:hypothetical protein
MLASRRVSRFLAVIAAISFGNGYEATAWWGNAGSLDEIGGETPTRIILSMNDQWAFITDAENGLAIGGHAALGLPFYANFLFDYRMTDGARYVGEKTAQGRVVWVRRLPDGTPMTPSTEGVMAFAPARQEVPFVAENGDVRNRDNDGDGRPEPVFVRRHIRDGEPVRAHFRARPNP